MSDYYFDEVCKAKNEANKKIKEIREELKIIEETYKKLKNRKRELKNTIRVFEGHIDNGLINSEGVGDALTQYILDKEKYAKEDQSSDSDY
jgi:chromosome segregation ATPase